MTYPQLLADIGGTNARFAIETAPGKLDAIVVLPCAEYPTLSDAMRAYFANQAAIDAGAANVLQAGISSQQIMQ